MSRDTEHAANGLSPIFDKEKEQRCLQEAQLIGETGTQVGDIARTEGDLAGLERAKKAHPDYSNDELRKTEEYKSAMKKYGTGSDIQQAISAATAGVQGLAGGDLKAAIAGGAAPYLAEVIRTKDASGEVNISANLMAHAVLGAVVALGQGNSALAGAAGASVGEAVGIIAKNLYNKDASDLSEDEKQTVRTLGMLAAGLAGGIAGDSAGSVVSGAQAGKNAVENNNFGNWGDLIPQRVQQDGSLVIDQAPKGKSPEEIGNAIESSHMGPSWGTECRIKPNGKVEVSGGLGLAIKGGTEINNDYFSVATGYTNGIGVKAGATIGIDFGPYAPGVFGDLNRDYSTGIGFGPGALGISAGKDGFGFSFSVGPSVGFIGTSNTSSNEKIDLSGDSTKEIYHHDFK
ncbi:TPA: VENN motif pre-toxin domain-containing protein [Pluralibacter gergoviae]|nr:hypothetical protein CRX51_08810 [Pluralibacter gergoviae]HDS1244649.1 VENN motif pre-toxin domain-containing protein [Pluralibacter gergoviae]HDS1250053.1 VENN motif pre-toxin domain-containing protein [Pluralibacter gergoviae]HDS1255589.1 VENN motif pre-toxin domain-containing protein [Pluralibacter gergoviae]HDS1261163.1 VENN motif pre-toxin domain-containing protein [Pluralibacter gergoviae]